MLEDLQSIDLSGVTGHINIDYSNGYNMIPALGVLVFLLALVGIVICGLKHSQSKRYREMYANLYVTGMIKKFAGEDGIDLEKEMVSFKDFLKEVKKGERKERREPYSLDDQVEEHLMEKVESKTEEKLEKK
jgi:hypothetical protein